MKKFALLIIATFFVFTAYSAYLRNIPVELKQPDGSVIHCFITGDEFHRRVHDKDNYTIVHSPTTGFYVYALKKGEELVPSEYVVGKSDPKQLGIEPNLDIPVSKMEDQRNGMLKSAKMVTETPTKGNFNNIVISIRFSDQSPTPLTLKDYEDKFNSLTNVSLKSYYKEVSNSQLNITSYFFPKPQNQTILEYQDSHPRSYYSYFNETNNPIGYKDSERSEREQTLFKNAIDFIKDQIINSEINFDANNDGLIDNIVFVMQGNPDNWGNILWPQTSSILSSSVNIGNKQVNQYNKQLTSMFNAYVISHEFFHSLGAPDLYRYTTNNFDPVGPWDIMGWTGDQSPTVYMKWRYGKWFENLPEIKTSGTYKLQSVTASPFSGYKIPSPNSPDEYFMIEFRRKGSDIDKSLPGEGLIIYRINKTIEGRGNAYGPPDEVYIFRQGGTFEKNGNIIEANFALDYNRSSLNDLTYPSCFLSNGQGSGIQISNISSIGDEMSFTLNFNQSVLVLQSPNGNESWVPGQTKEIKWLDLNIDKIKIDYSLDGGTQWINLAKNISSNLKKYDWIIPAQLTNKAIVKISDENNQSISDVGDNYFIIRDNSFINEIEPNNYASMSNIIELGDSIKGVLNYGIDVDYYKFYVDSAIDIDIEIRYENYFDNYGTSKMIYLFNNNNSCIDFIPLNKLRYPFKEKGWYYIKFNYHDNVETKYCPYWLKLNPSKPRLPEIIHFQANNVFENAAAINAMVLTNGIKTKFTFLYDEFDPYGIIPQDSVKYNYFVETNLNNYSNINAEFVNSKSIDNLKPNTTYLCKLKAENELGVVLSNYSYMFKTPNSSKGWIDQKLGIPNRISGISFIDDKIGTLVFNSVGDWDEPLEILTSLMRTDNSGMEWKYQMKQVPPQCFNVVFRVNMIDPNMAITYGFGPFLTKDGGNSWVGLNTSIPISIYDVVCLDKNNWVIVGSPLNDTKVGKVLRTNDGGTIWRGEEQTFDGLVSSCVFKDKYMGMLITRNKKVYQTSDGGNTWKIIYEDINFAPQRITSISGKWFMVGFSGIIYSLNDGKSWEKAELQPVNSRSFKGYIPNLTCIAFSDSLNGIAGGIDGLIVRTLNGGKNWFFEESGTLNRIFDIAYKGNIGWVVGDYGLLLKKEFNGNNELPVAFGGGLINVAEEETVTLDGSLSFDPEGSDITYQWEGPDGITLSSANIANPTFIAPKASQDTTYIFSLVVNDGNHDSQADHVKINVRKAPVARAGIDHYAIIGERVTLDGSLSSVAKGKTLTHEWSASNGIVLSATNIANPTFVVPSGNQHTKYTFTLVVSDGTFRSVADQVTITAKKSDVAPIAIAGNNIIVNEGDTVILDGSDSFDSDDRPLTYSWLAPVGINFNSSTIAKPTFIAPEVKQDKQYPIDLMVNNGVENSLYDLLFVSVKNVNKAPVANAGFDQSVEQEKVITLNGSLSKDPDGDKITYKWNAPDDIKLNFTTISKPSFSTPKVNKDTIYTFSLVVNDGQLNSIPSIVKISVLKEIEVSASSIDNPLFKIFPNPTTGILNLEISNVSGKKAEVLVTSLVGAEIFRKEIVGATKFQIDLSDQVNGIYILKVLSGNQQYISKIVVRKE